jgi:hypothetical protein
MGITMFMRELIDPYWLTVALTSLVQFVLFLRWLYRRIRNDEMTRTFVEDMAINHLPHIYRLLEKLCDEKGIEAPPEPPIRWVNLNGPHHRNRRPGAHHRFRTWIGSGAGVRGGRTGICVGCICDPL